MEVVIDGSANVSFPYLETEEGSLRILAGGQGKLFS